MIILRPDSFPTIVSEIGVVNQIFFTSILPAKTLSLGDLIDTHCVFLDNNFDTTAGLTYTVNLDMYLDGTAAALYTDGQHFMKTSIGGNNWGPGPLGSPQLFPFSQSLLLGLDKLLYTSGSHDYTGFDILSGLDQNHKEGGGNVRDGLIPLGGLGTADDTSYQSATIFDVNISHRITLVGSIVVDPPNLIVQDYRGKLIATNIRIYQPSNGNTASS